MPNKKLENSIRGLIDLYTVVIGVALSLAVAGVIDLRNGLASVNLNSCLLFAAFVTTLFPFFHGAIRHLDDAYLESVNTEAKTSALVIDFLLLFLHGLAFVALSQLMKKSADFAWILVGLLGIDVLWGVFTHYISSSPKKKLSAEGRWALLNFVFVAVVCGYLVNNNIYPGQAPEQDKLPRLLLIMCALRSVFDYVLCSEFYFPKTAS